jgi:WD40 repeat protein
MNSLMEQQAHSLFLEAAVMASASQDATVKVWDAETGQEALTLRDHTGQVTSVSWSPDGKCLASSSFDRTVKIWDASPPVEQQLSVRSHNVGP